MKASFLTRELRECTKASYGDKGAKCTRSLGCSISRYSNEVKSKLGLEFLIITCYLHSAKKFENNLGFFSAIKPRLFISFSTGKGVDSFDVSLLDLPRDRTSSYLYTTELTSSFSKKSPNVHDSLFQYRQPVQDKGDRRRSLPDQAELGKQGISLTTGSEILQKFSSPDLSAQRSKPSNKLLKSFRKKKPSEESSKFYVEIDLDDRNSGRDEETGSEYSASSVFEPAITAAEPTSATRTTLEPKTLQREAPTTNNRKSFNGKPNSLLRGDEQDNSNTLRGSSENPGLTNGSRVAPGVAETRRRLEKSSSSKSLPLKYPKPVKDQSRGSTLDSNALHRPDLQNARMSPRPASYLKAMDSAGDKPLIPKERKK